MNHIAMGALTSMVAELTDFRRHGRLCGFVPFDAGSISARFGRHSVEVANTNLGHVFFGLCGISAAFGLEDDAIGRGAN